MNKSTAIILSCMGVIFVGFLGWAIYHKESTYIDPSQYDINHIIIDTSESGGIAEHVEGNSKDPKLTIIEYSDYQCSGCASVVPSVAELIKKYGDDIAIVHRTYVLSYHANGVAAASAAEAAGLQGYWKQYGDYLFANQSDWFYSDAEERTEQFKKYFENVTDGKGDIDAFLTDLAGDKVKAKVSFDRSLGASVSDEIQYTPAFFIDGEFINWAYDEEGNVRETGLVDYLSPIIEERIGKKNK